MTRPAGRANRPADPISECNIGSGPAAAGLFFCPRRNYTERTTSIGEAAMFIMPLRTATALVIAGMIAGLCTAALAQRIPPSESLGRERERFTDPQPPRAQYGGSIFSQPGVIYLPGSTKRRTHSARTHKK
jgi:hypothetical protein